MSPAPGPPSGPDAGGPGPARFLDALARRIPVESIDDVWIFPPRPVGGAESTVLVVSALEPEPARRRVLTARYAVSRDARGQFAVEEEVTEHGAAPAERIPRLVEGVLRRLDEPADAPPRHLRIGGSAERFEAARRALGGTR